jgi:N-formylglutamate deformylase
MPRSPASSADWVLAPSGPPLPVVACLPHGGGDFPADLAGELALSPGGLWSDWLTRELYAFLPGLGITTITTPFSRFVADVNRDPAGERHGGFWTSVVAARTPDGQPVYRRPLSRAEIRHRIRLAHVPYHRGLDAAVARLLRRFPRLLLLDLHSFGLPLAGEVILGDCRGATARPAAVRLLAGALRGSGFRVSLNERFSGGWTVRRFAGCDRVDAVQIELSQRCYLDLDAGSYPPPPRPAAFRHTQRALRTAVTKAAAGWARAAL